MICAQLIWCHQTELISATTLTYMGRPWLGLSVCSLMRITKEGRLCARSYPGQVSGDSLESQFGYIGASSPFGTSLFATTVVAMRWQVCLEDPGLPYAWFAKQVGDTVREARGRTVSLENS